MDDRGTPAGHLDLKDLEQRWTACERVRAVAQASADSFDSRIVCPRTVDEKGVAGHRVYTGAARYLSVADENHGALVHLLQSHGATPTAPWNLLRPSFEAAFFGLWTLTPEASRERRQRALQLEWLDDEAAHKFTALALGSPALSSLLKDGKAIRARETQASRANTQVYSREATQLGLSFRGDGRHNRPKATPRPNRVVVQDELATLVEDQGISSYLQLTWSTLSGIQHAEGSALLRVSDKEQMGTFPGGRELYMTINDDAFYVAALATTLLRVLAWKRFGDCHRPARSNTPIDLAPYLRR